MPEVLLLGDEQQRHHRAPTVGLPNPRLQATPNRLQDSPIRERDGVVPPPIGPNPLIHPSKPSSAEDFLSRVPIVRRV